MKQTTGPLDADEDGNALPVPPPESDLATLIQLLEYARRRGFRVGPTVKVGSIVTQVQDMRQDETGRDLPADPGPWAAAGLEGDE